MSAWGVAVSLFLVAYLVPAAQAETRPGVNAESGSVAIGGNVQNSTIGVPYPKLEEAVRSRTKDLSDLTDSQKDVIALLKAKLDLNERQVRAALETVGEANVPPENLASKLIEIAKKYQELQTAAAGQPGDDAQITALKAKAQQAIADGELGKADDLLASIEKIQSAALDRLALNAAQTAGQRGDVALAQLRYRDAARRFDEAAAKVPPNHEAEAWAYLQNEYDALYRQGDEFGDNAALVAATDVARRSLALTPYAADPLLQAEVRNRLGGALKVLGEREAGSARIEDAVAAFEEALKESPRGRDPVLWAQIQNNLGNTLLVLAGRENNPAKMELAAGAFHAALEELTRDRFPLLWGQAQNNLGIALKALGEREAGAARLEDSAGAFREALKELTREKVPLLYGEAQNNLGNVLKLLGEREASVAKMEEATEAFREALKELRRDRVPLLWAQVQNNLGVTLTALGDREANAARFEDAVAAFHEALKESTRDRVPLLWAMMQNNLGIALSKLDLRDENEPRRVEAVAAYGAALEVWTRDRVPLLWAKAAGNQAVVLLLLAGQRRDLKLAKQARDQIGTAFAVARDGGDQPSAAYLNIQLANARKLAALLAGSGPKKASAKR